MVAEVSSNKLKQRVEHGLAQRRLLNLGILCTLRYHFPSLLRCKISKTSISCTFIFIGIVCSFVKMFLLSYQRLSSIFLLPAKKQEEKLPPGRNLSTPLCIQMPPKSNHRRPKNDRSCQNTFAATSLFAKVSKPLKILFVPWKTFIKLTRKPCYEMQTPFFCRSEKPVEENHPRRFARTQLSRDIRRRRGDAAFRLRRSRKTPSKKVLPDPSLEHLLTKIPPPGPFQAPLNFGRGECPNALVFLPWLTMPALAHFARLDSNLPSAAALERGVASTGGCPQQDSRNTKGEALAAPGQAAGGKKPNAPRPLGHNRPGSGARQAERR